MKDSTLCLFLAALGLAANIYEGGDDVLAVITMMMIGFSFLCRAIERK